MKRFRDLRIDSETRNHHADVPPILPADLIYPYFIVEGCGIKDEISSMKGVYRFSIDNLIDDISSLLELGINKVLLFGVIDKEQKDELGSKGYSPDNIISRATKAIKKHYPQIVVFTDVCLCEYTIHGHCGLINGCHIENDRTLPLLAEMAYQHAMAGADFVAPSSMMDGQVEAIKDRLNKANLSTRILSYSAKYASSYYGPFRDAADSTPSFGDRKTYQMDYRTKEQGLEEIAADIEEGTDWIMVKPGLPYIDILYRASQLFPDTPLVSYQVSGEYSMLINGASNGYFDEKNIFKESLTALRRAGAKYIITYYAKKFVEHGLYLY